MRQFCGRAVGRPDADKCAESYLPMPRIKFTVDAALLRELGERLVGQPHVALAELIKNAYDADAASVEVKISPGRIVVSDNGHGMDLGEFKRFWMRIGSPHKGRQQRSRHFKRPLTGQKGIGRLAAQFLGTKLEMVTESDKGGPAFKATVDWAKAVRARDLTRAEATYRPSPRTRDFPGGKAHGTRLVISGLHHPWTDDSFKPLAREIWNLQPPFSASDQTDDPTTFQIQLFGPQGERLEDFDERLRPYLTLWHARITGRVLPQSERGDENNVAVSLEFDDGERYEHRFRITPLPLNQIAFEIRMYNLQGRQRFGVRVRDLREYLKTHGGVHIYDSGFHLPHYGVNTDWLRIEMDHSHRLSRSQLLPEELQVERGMNFLPTNSRILGVVRVDTAREQRMAAEGRQGQPRSPANILDISVTRDRLTENAALGALRDLVRTGIDFYATREAQREFARVAAAKPIERLAENLSGVEALLDEHADSIPATVRTELRREVTSAVESARQESGSSAARSSLLGALATAGMTALAFEHELTKQFASVEHIARTLRTLETGRGATKLGRVADELDDWIARMRLTRALFSSYSQEENRTRRQRLKAVVVVEGVWNQMSLLRRGLSIDVSGVDSELRLPAGTLAEWSAVLQNVFVNATNATLDTDEKRLFVSSRANGRVRSILIQDTGVGIDLEHAEEMFEPFARRLELSPERRALGLGGTGLGLTIVRMVATNIGCKVAFVEPENGFATAFRLSWTEVS